MCEERNNFEIKKIDYQNSADLQDIYNDNPVIKFFRSIIDKVPVLELADESLSQMMKQNMNKKYNELLNCIAQSDTITLDDVRDVNVLTEFVKTVQVTQKIVQNEKIIYLGNLFVSNLHDIKVGVVDEYEENLQKVDMLSFRELQLLELLYQCEIQNTDYELSWNQFNTECMKKFGFGEADVKSSIMAISRTGLCLLEWLTLAGATDSFIAYTSPTYHRLREQIINRRTIDVKEE